MLQRAAEGRQVPLFVNERRNFFQWDQVMAIVIVIFVAVLLIEWVSIWARRQLV